MDTGDSQEEVIIFRDRHFIIIYVSSTPASSSPTRESGIITIIIISASSSPTRESRIIIMIISIITTRDRTLGNFESRIDTETQTRRALPARDTSPRYNH